MKPGGLIAILHFLNLGKLNNCVTEKKIIVLHRASHAPRIINIYRKNTHKQIILEDFIN